MFSQLLSMVTATLSLTLTTTRTANEAQQKTLTAGQKAVTAVSASPIISVTRKQKIEFTTGTRTTGVIVRRNCKKKSENAFSLVKIVRINLCLVLK